MITVIAVLYNTIISTDAVAFSNAHFGAGTGPIYFDNTDCIGNESNLTDCSWSSYISCYYGHLEDAGVRCQGTVVECYEGYQYIFLHNNDSYCLKSMHVCIVLYSHESTALNFNRVRD